MMADGFEDNISLEVEVLVDGNDAADEASLLSVTSTNTGHGSTTDSEEDPPNETSLKKTVKTTVDQNSQVFFMIGCQRSGSNWLRTMLGDREVS